MLRFVLVLFSLWLFASFVQAQNSVLVPSADFKVTVQIDPFGYPQWLFSQNDNSSYVYKVTLMAMWETENSTDYDYVGNSYYLPHNGFTVSAGDVVNNTKQITVATAPNTNHPFDRLALNTRVPLWAVNGSEYPAGKFDVELTNYKWVSASDSAQLILAYVLNYEVEGAYPNTASNLSTHGSRTVDFADAYFSINSTAMGGPNTNVSIGVSIKLATDVNTSQLQTGPYSLPINVGTVAYVIYDHFDVNLKHDPEFGFGSGPGNGYIWIIIIVVVVIAIIVIILIAVIGFILVRRRRRSYDAF